jgi:large subunit ribosomal protein L24e
MPRCSFCNNELQKGTGLMLIKKDGKILYFDSKKCERNMLDLKRESKNMKWVRVKKID